MRTVLNSLEKAHAGDLMTLSQQQLPKRRVTGPARENASLSSHWLELHGRREKPPSGAKRVSAGPVMMERLLCDMITHAQSYLGSESEKIIDGD